MAQKARDCCEILGVARNADQKAIKDAFRHLALKFHPDHNKEPEASDRFKQIAEAYAVLSNPHKRASDHTSGRADPGGFPPDGLFAGIGFGDIFGGLGFDFAGGGLFDHLFRRHAPARGENIEVSLEIPLERVATGGEETVHVRHPTVCAACRGGGGQRLHPEQKGGVSLMQGAVCPECHGLGRTVRDEVVRVRIPVGVEEGAALRVPGHGMPAEKPGQPPGDLFVVIRTAPDHRFERHGRDLYTVQSIGVADAVLGTELRAAAPAGPVTLKIPAGTQGSTVFRLRGKGLPSFGGGNPGDLYVRVEVRVPDRLTEKQRRLFEQLREAGG